MKHFAWLALIAGCIACDANRIFEENTDLPNGVWLEGDAVSYQLAIEDASVPYNVYTNIRNAHNYPFYNLYYQFTLRDSLGNTLHRELKNINLFDPKTGEPYGSGLGDVFDHRHPVLESYRFPDNGEYSIWLEQYMRRDTLPNLVSVGARVELANP